ncbi:hypothetical protein EMIT0215P_170077 [Pseudomonas serboccidentalis]
MILFFIRSKDRSLVSLDSSYRGALWSDGECTRLTAAQRTNLLQRIGASSGRFLTLVHEVLEEELLVLFTGVEVMRGQGHREHRHFCFQLHLHQAADHRLGDELVTVDAAVHDQSSRNDAGITTGLGQQLGVQGHFKGAADFEEIDVRFLITLGKHFGDEAFAALVDDFLVPAGLDERDALAVWVFGFAVDSGGLHVLTPVCVKNRAL